MHPVKPAAPPSTKPLTARPKTAPSGVEGNSIVLPPGSWQILPGGDNSPSTLQQPPKWLRCAQLPQAC